MKTIKCAAVSAKSTYRPAHDCEFTRALKKMNKMTLCPGHYAMVLRGGKLTLRGKHVAV